MDRHIVARCQRAANAAVAPKTCNVSVRSRNPPVVDVHGEPPHVLTGAERAAAKTAAEAVVERTPKAVAALVSEIEAWIGVDPLRVRRVAALALAVALAEHPRLAQTLGVPIQGDE